MDVLGKPAWTGGTLADEVLGAAWDKDKVTGADADEGPGVDTNEGPGVDTNEVPGTDADEALGADSLAIHQAVAWVWAWYSLSVSYILKALHMYLIGKIA